MDVNTASLFLSMFAMFHELTAEMNLLTWINLPEFSGKTAGVPLLRQGNGASVSDCAVECFSIESCISFFYLQSTKKCLFHSCTFDASHEFVTSNLDTYYFALDNGRKCGKEEKKGFFKVSSFNFYIKFIQTPTLTWNESVSACSVDGAHLLVIPNQGVSDWIANYLIATPDLRTNYWIAANDIKKENEWVDWRGEPLPYLNWQNREPNQGGWANCVHIWLTPTNFDKWADASCLVRYGYICQIDGV